jgi:uncharacterized membrane-anchored protein
MPIPAGYRFTGAEGTKIFMELTENPSSDSELGVLWAPGDSTSGGWWVVFSYDESGYVKDDEKDELDADAILSSMRENNAEGNKERKKRGWETIDLAGWVREPHYDPRTNNLTWSLMVTTPGGDSTVNHSVRLLGRRGVMEVDLVIGPDGLTAAVPQFDAMLAGYSFNSGSRYSEWQQGDKIAEYGLTALVAGGAGAALAKSGLLGKLWKVILAAVAAAAAGLKRFFGHRKKEETTTA